MIKYKISMFLKIYEFFLFYFFMTSNPAIVLAHYMNADRILSNFDIVLITVNFAFISGFAYFLCMETWTRCHDNKFCNTVSMVQALHFLISFATFYYFYGMSPWLKMAVYLPSVVIFPALLSAKVYREIRKSVKIIVITKDDKDEKQ